MKKKIAIVAVLILGVVLSMGCVEETTISYVCENQGEIETTNIIYTEDGQKIVTGMLKSITLKSEISDVIVFYNGKTKETIISTNYAEEFDWVLGESYKVTIKNGIKNVEMINDT